jgi:pyruvate dehydrogenase E1 component alpha subunit
LKKEKILTAKEIKAIEEQSNEDIAHAIKFAQDSPVPRPEALFEDVYVN